MNHSIVICSGVSKVYETDFNKVTALHNLDLEVKKNQLTTIIGPSGSGKTTLLNLIAGIDKPTSGQIIVGDVNYSNLSEDQITAFRRKNIGFVFQLYHLLPVLTVIENVMLPLLPYQHSLGFNLKEKARQLIEWVGLGNRINHLPAELSGGEQQRAVIARALIHEPSLLLADEPTGNLDSKTGMEIVKLFRTLVEDKALSVLLVTHDLRIAEESDCVINLHDGTITSIKYKSEVNFLEC